MSIQMDTWIDNTSYDQWKKGCKRKLSKSKQGSASWKAACVILPTKKASKFATQNGGGDTPWINGPTGPTPKLFSYYRTEHRYSTYRQIRILSWHISVEHTNRNLCKYKETSSPAEAKSGNLNDERCRNK